MRLFLLLLLFLCAASGASLADVLDDPDPDFSLEDTVTMGPFHVAPFFYIRDLGYDDNIYLDSEERVGDYTVTLGPGARAVMPMGRRAALAMWDEVDYVMYATEENLNSVNNSFRAKTHGYLRDTILFLEGEHRIFRGRPNDEIDYRVRDITGLARMGGRYRPQRRLGLDYTLKITDYDYEIGGISAPEGIDEEQILEDAEQRIERLMRDETSARIVGRLKVRPRTTLLLDLERVGIDFDNEAAGVSRDSSARAAMLGMEFDPSGPLRGFIKLGRKNLDPESEELHGYDGFIADAAVIARIAGRGELKLLYRHNTEFSTLGDNLYYVQDHRGLGYTHFINARVSLGAERQHYENDFPVDLPGQTPPHRQDEIVSDKITVKYGFGPSLRIGLSVGRWERDSTIDSEDDDRGTISTIVEYTP